MACVSLLIALGLMGSHGIAFNLSSYILSRDISMKLVRRFKDGNRRPYSWPREIITGSHPRLTASCLGESTGGWNLLFFHYKRKPVNGNHKVIRDLNKTYIVLDFC